MQAHDPYGFRLWRDTFDFLRGEKRGIDATEVNTHVWPHGSVIITYSRERTFALLIFIIIRDRDGKKEDALKKYRWSMIRAVRFSFFIFYIMWRLARDRQSITNDWERRAEMFFLSLAFDLFGWRQCCCWRLRTRREMLRIQLESPRCDSKETQHKDWTEAPLMPTATARTGRENGQTRTTNIKKIISTHCRNSKLFPKTTRLLTHSFLCFTKEKLYL